MRNLFNRRVTLAALFAMLGALVPATAGAQTAARPAPVAATQTAPIDLTQGYVIGAGDVVEIGVVGRDDYKQRVQVQVDGTIELPYIHTVRASGRTVMQLRDEVASRLESGGYFVDPVIGVSIASYASRYVTVLGEFASPGLVPVDRAYRVSEILARAGGAKASAGDTLVLRRVDGKAYQLPIAKIASGGPSDDPLVQPGDKLYIAEAPNFYIYGQVSGPGAYKIERGMTVRMALARGGGLTDRGSLSRVSVIRNGRKMKVSLDMPIKGDDTVVVGERFF